MALRPSTVDVLFALLEHADGSQLLVLMEAENILTLLRKDGWTDDAVRVALKEEKKLPGELLLGLFQRGRTAAELLSLLGPEAVAAVEAERAKPSTSSASPTPPKESPATAPPGSVPVVGAARPPPLARVGVGSSRSQVAGLVIILAAALVPSMFSVLDMGFALALLRLGVGPVLGLIGLVGAAGGALATAPGGRRWALAISGAVASMGGCAAVIGYALWTARLGRTSLLRIEIAAVCLIGMLPALVLAGLLRERGGERP
ncbi:MAG: hypothetical protein ABJE95_17885 [Byssovorax sp.]